MKIAIVGAGNVGGALAKILAKKKHQIFLGLRDPQSSKYQELVKQIGSEAQTLTVRESIDAADVVILATPWSATKSVLESVPGALEGKVLIDCTNPITNGFKLALGHNTSGGEMVAAWAKGAHVYKAFNTTGSNIMERAGFDDGKAVMLVCGDSDRHKPKVLQIARDAGFEAVDFGRLEGARLLEPMALVWIQLAYQQGFGREFAFSILRR